MAKSKVVEDVANALRDYGQDIRMDWSDMDGRSVRSTLDELAEALETGDFDYDSWADQTLRFDENGEWRDRG
jgi:hypothetical protein